VYGTVKRTSSEPAEKFPVHVVGTVTFWARVIGTRMASEEEYFIVSKAFNVISKVIDVSPDWRHEKWEIEMVLGMLGISRDGTDDDHAAIPSICPAVWPAPCESVQES
jgi:hypothetical protein